MKQIFTLSLLLILASLVLVHAQQAAPPPAAADAASASAAPPPPAPSGFGGSQVLTLFRAAGTTGIIQTAVSLFGGAFMVACFMKIRRKNIAPAGLAARARELWAQGDIAALEALKDQEPSTLSRAISFLASHRHHSVADISSAVGDRVSTEIAAFNQLSYPMGVVATVQPLLGLLGMILGMINAFSMVALAGVLGNAGQLAGGISEALSTTALGIAFAIPFLAAYHFFRSRANGFGVLVAEEVNNLIADWLMRAPVEEPVA